MGKFGHIDSFSGSAYIKQRLEFQNLNPTPKISAEYYFSIKDFCSNYIGRINHLIYNNLISNKSAVNKIFPQEFFKATKKDSIDSILKNGISDFAVIDLTEIYKTKPEETIKLTDDLTISMLEKFQIASEHISLRGKKGAVTDTLMACFPYKLIKWEGDKKWSLQPIEHAVSKFFGMAIAKGLIDRDMLLDRNIVMHENINFMVIDNTIKQLRDEGVEPILKEPIHKYKNPNELSR